VGGRHPASNLLLAGSNERNTLASLSKAGYEVESFPFPTPQFSHLKWDTKSPCFTTVVIGTI
jgi:predicted ATP-grasp superfamily ATP-dependent carboligase